MFALSWITDQIAVSGAFRKIDVSFLREQGIRAIVDVRAEYMDDVSLLKEYGIDYLHIEVVDRYYPDISELKLVFDFVNPILDKGDKILIHCQNGCGRSPCVAIAVLAQRGMQLEDAVFLLERKHPRTNFTPAQRAFIYLDLKDFLNSQEKGR